MNDEGRTTDKLETAAGEIRKVLDNEIAARLARLSVSREELLAEADLYPWVAEWPEVYEPFPVSVAFRARAVELLHCLINDSLSTCIEWLDKYIAEAVTGVEAQRVRFTVRCVACFENRKEIPAQAHC